MTALGASIGRNAGGLLPLRRSIPRTEAKDDPRLWLECGALLTKPFLGPTQKPLKTGHKVNVTKKRKVGDFRLTGVEAKAYIPAIDAPLRLTAERAPLKLLTGTVNCIR
jgi:hypothetical protein